MKRMFQFFRGEQVALGLVCFIGTCSCAGRDDDLVETGRAQAAVTAASGLPQPVEWRVPAPALNAAQRARKDEVDRYLLRQFGARRIVTTTQTYGGDIIDWVDPDSVPGSKIEQPPSQSTSPVGGSVGRTFGAVTELERYTELRGPAGTIPYTRTPFASYVDGTSPAKSIEEHIAKHEPTGQPAGQTRLYGGRIQSSSNTRVVANGIHQFAGSVESGTFNILEMATVCPGATPSTTLEMVGAVVGRGAAGYSGSTLRFNVEFMTAGPSNVGNNVGGWDGQVTGFTAAAGRPYGPGVQLTFISVDGGTQYESPAEIRLFNGNWWIAHNGNWLGYYSGTFFNLIPTAGCRADWYGEVFDPTPATWTNTNMGTGSYASAGFTHASFFREPFYYDAAGVSTWPDSTGTVGPVDAQCYTTSAMNSGSSPWGRFFYLGGPGNEASNTCR